MRLDKESSYNFNFNVLREFKKLTEKNPFNLNSEDVLDPDVMLCLAWCGLKGAGHDITIEEVGDSLKIKHFEVIMRAFQKVQGADIEIEKKTEEKE